MSKVGCNGYFFSAGANMEPDSFRSIMKNRKCFNIKAADMEFLLQANFADAVS